MTPIEHLQAIKSHCHRLLDIAAKRTPGEWYVDYAQGVMAPNGYPISYLHLAAASTKPVPDAAFIAASAGNFERALMTTIASCEWLIDEIAEYGLQDRLAQFSSVICAEWPVESLKS